MLQDHSDIRFVIAAVQNSREFFLDLTEDRNSRDIRCNFFWVACSASLFRCVGNCIAPHVFKTDQRIIFDNSLHRNCSIRATGWFQFHDSPNFF